MPVIGNDLKAILTRCSETSTCRTHRIERQRSNMRRKDVLTIADEVERTDFPVCFGPPALGRRENFHPLRRTCEERLEVPGEFAEIFRQRNHVGIPTCENQSFKHFDTWDANETQRFKIGTLGKMLIKGRGNQLTVATVGPAMIGTNQMARVARFCPA